MRCIASALALAAVLAAGPGHAFDAAGVDIIGLHLGMREAEVVARLVHQGYAPKRTQGVITASTMDGLLQIAVSAEDCVFAISYVFDQHDPAATKRIREAVLTRYGDPDQGTPPTWCREVGQDGICPRNQATLTFVAEPLSLLLRAAADGQSTATP
jgi:hypothetical protein